ncbi:MAG: hypothetical protein CMO81_06820 [Waddliaceae bacterium]|nr:hypothetical protein [Waddliaceae bacterium]
MIGSLIDFIEIWKKEADVTEAVLQNLTDQMLNDPKASAKLLSPCAWEIICFPADMLAHTELILDKPDPELLNPHSSESLLKAYDAMVDSLILQIHCKWMDDVLTLREEIFGKIWTRRELLEAMVFRQVHLRGQLCLLLKHNDCPFNSPYGNVDKWMEQTEKKTKPSPLPSSTPPLSIPEGKEEINPYLIEE